MRRRLAIAVVGGWLLGIVSMLSVSGVVPLYDRTSVRYLTSSNEATTPTLHGEFAVVMFTAHAGDPYALQ